MKGRIPETRIPQIAFFFCSSTFCSIFGIALSLILCYYNHKKAFENPINLIYFFIFINSILVTLLLWFIVPSIWNIPQPMLFSCNFVCIIWYWVWTICFRMSVYLIGVLAALRWRQIRYPLRADYSCRFISLRIACLCTVMVIMLAIVPSIVSDRRITYDPDLQRCNDSLLNMRYYHKLLELTNEILYGMFLPHMLLCVLFGFLIKSHCRLTTSYTTCTQDNAHLLNQRQMEAFKRSQKKTKTVIIIAGLYVLTFVWPAFDNFNNILIILSAILNSAINIYDTEILRKACGWWYSFINNFFQTNVVFVATTITSFIVMYTSKQIRTSYQQRKSFRETLMWTGVCALELKSIKLVIIFNFKLIGN